MDYKYSFRLA
jgi:hypothetical protein